MLSEPDQLTIKNRQGKPTSWFLPAGGERRSSAKVGVIRDPLAQPRSYPTQIHETFVGRFSVQRSNYAKLFNMQLDTTASRFHGASIAGLVVGAFGSFVFALYLRQWLQERKMASGTKPPSPAVE
jgi:hypothetical protein